MRCRHALLVAISAALCVAPSPAAAEAPSAEESTDASAKKSRVNKRKVRAKKVEQRNRQRARQQQRARQRQRARRQKQRKSARQRRANRPAGWQWPPSAEMKAQGADCRKELAELAVDFKPAPPTRGVASPVYVPSMRFGDISLTPTFRKPPFVIDCHLARALRQVAPALAEAGVKSLRFSSIYNYRRAIVGGKKKQSLSRHSYGLAVDVFEVEGADGEILKVADHYRSHELLKRVETIVNESERFRLVLSPANDPRSHADHLHFEADVRFPAERVVR